MMDRSSAIRFESPVLIPGYILQFIAQRHLSSLLFYSAALKRWHETLTETAGNKSHDTKGREFQRQRAR
jgi:hypothetical protein